MLYRDDPTVRVLTEAEFLLVRETGVASANTSTSISEWSELTEHGMSIRIPDKQRRNCKSGPLRSIELSRQSFQSDK
jgi:hypothetical protein